ncbi:hypothetical protein CR970_00595 [Candidatus Saccharibacteria bacterium]|nr:MAG: hypothetical protein CR970_00595 [Candidatus Saccharibacteria bacterium]
MTTHILLIEDDTTLNDAFHILLTKEGYQVDTAFNGQEALDILKTKTPDLILLDLLMPVMDGKEFLRRFDNQHDIPIIVFSNLDAKSDVKEAIELGATRYMLKSWATTKELIKIINDTLGA